MAEEFTQFGNGSSSGIQLVSKNEEEVRQQTAAVFHAAASTEALADEAALKKAVDALARSKEVVKKYDYMLQNPSSPLTTIGNSSAGSRNTNDEGNPPTHNGVMHIIGAPSSSSTSSTLSLEALQFRRKTALREVKAKEEALFRLQTQVAQRQAQRLRQAQAKEAAKALRDQEEAARLRTAFAARQAARQAALTPHNPSAREEALTEGPPRRAVVTPSGRVPIRPLKEAIFTVGTAGTGNTAASPSMPYAPSLEALASSSHRRHPPLSSSEYRGGALLPRIHRVQLRSTKRVRYEDDTSMEAFKARLAKREKLEELQYAQQREAEAQRMRDGATASSSSSLSAVRSQKKEEKDDDATHGEASSCAPSVDIIDVDALMEMEDDLLEEVLERHSGERGREEGELTHSKKKRRREGMTTRADREPSLPASSTDINSSPIQDRLSLPPVEIFPIAGNLVIPTTVYHRLLDFQQEGVQWLLGLHQRRHGGILGDEMGLGKTVQIAAMLSALCHSLQLRGPVLLVSPVTVLRQWVAELHRWSPRTRVVVLHQLSSVGSTPLSPLAIVESIRGQPNTVLLTSYAAMRRHCELLQTAGFHYVILDEGHKISNPAAGTTLAAKAFATPHRLLLTGSPIQNSLKELWCLFDFVCPGVLGTLSGFVTEFEEVIGRSKHARASPLAVSEAVEAAKVLQERMAPFLLRRLKRHVNAALPEKYEKVIYVTLTDAQLQEYVSFLASPEIQTLIAQTSSYQWLSGGLNQDFRDSTGSLHVAGRSFYMKDRSKTSQVRLESFRALHRLRQLCNHVDIFHRQNLPDSEYGDDEEEEGIEGGNGEDGSPISTPRTAAHSGIFSRNERRSRKRPLRYPFSHSLTDSSMTSSTHGSRHTSRSYASNYPADLTGSAKLQTLQLMLKEWKQGGHRALIFSQSRMVLDIIENMVETDGHTYVRMDGTTPIRQRQDLMDRFNGDDEVFLALLTTRVGGVGLNLIGADRVVIFDPDWNPTTDAQARERSWRVGQCRDVCVYRLITMGTVEEFIFKRQLAKLYVTDKVLRDATYQRFFAQESFVEGLLLGECYDARIPEGQKHVLLCRDLTLGMTETSKASNTTGSNRNGVGAVPESMKGGTAAVMVGGQAPDTHGRSIPEIRGMEIVVPYDEYQENHAQSGTSIPSSSLSADSGSPSSIPTSFGGEGLSVLQNLVDGASVHDSPHEVAKRLAKIRAAQRMQRVSASGGQRGLTDQQRDFEQFLLSSPIKENEMDQAN